MIVVESYRKYRLYITKHQTIDNGDGRLTRAQKHSCKYIVLKRRYTIKQVGKNLVYNITVTAGGPFQIYRRFVLREARKDI